MKIWEIESRFERIDNFQIVNCKKWRRLERLRKAPNPVSVECRLQMLSDLTQEPPRYSPQSWEI